MGAFQFSANEGRQGAGNWRQRRGYDWQERRTRLETAGIELENLPVTVEVCETIREASGLAMSSRNVRLSEEGWNNAAKISETLLFLKEKRFEFNSINALRTEAIKRLKEIPDSVLEYFEICDSENLHPIEIFIEGKPTIALIAIWVDGVRLIDNVLI